MQHWHAAIGVVANDERDALILEEVFGAPLKGGSISAEISPELLGVGYIIGPRIGSIMMAGGVLSGRQAHDLRDAGEVLLKGKPVVFTNPRQAQLAGIVTIYQELNQVPEMSVTENIFLGSELERGVVLRWSEMHDKATELLAKLHLGGVSATAVLEGAMDRDVFLVYVTEILAPTLRRIHVLRIRRDG